MQLKFSQTKCRSNAGISQLMLKLYAFKISVPSTLHLTVNRLNNSEDSLDPECEKGFASNTDTDIKEENCM